MIIRIRGAHSRPGRSFDHTLAYLKGLGSGSSAGAMSWGADTLRLWLVTPARFERATFPLGGGRRSHVAQRLCI